MARKWKWTIRILAACAMVAAVHGFMIGFAVPRPAAWYLGAVIYAGLVAVLFSNKSVVDKLGIYAVFAFVTVIGAITVCPCTGAHFMFAPLAGLAGLGFFHLLKSRLPRRWVATANVSEQQSAMLPAAGPATPDQTHSATQA